MCFSVAGLLSTATREPLVVRGVIHEVEQDHRAIRDRVEASVVRCEVDTVEVADTIVFGKVGRNRFSTNHFTPLGVLPKPFDARLPALPDGLSQLPSARGRGFPRLKGSLDVVVDDDLVGTKRQAKVSEPLALGERVEEARAGGVGPRDTSRSFDCESKVETELKGPIQSDTTGRVTGLF